MSVAATPATEPAAGGGGEQPNGSRFGVVQRFAQGELGSLQVILALVVIWTVFTVANDRFLTSTNLVNLALQIAGIGMISVGVVMVLLLGEIDLSVGIVSGLCAAVMAVLNVQHGWDPYLAIAAALVVGAAIGLFQGTIVTALGIPSFVVTLAGLIGWQGVLLWVLGDTGTVNLTDPKIIGLAGTFYRGATAWALGAIVVVLFALACINARRRRVKAGVPAATPLLVALRVIGVAVIVFGVIAVLTDDRGVPLAILILIGTVVIFDYIVRRTTFGRHVLAVGGNEEAARRAGIRVRRIRVAVFMISSVMAACGGILLASRLLAVNQGSGGSDLLLLAIAGPVIAGTSLFGGRGTVWSALLGALVIGSISNGMDLLAFPSSTKNMVTGAVLLAAVVVDALARQRRRQMGRV
ncbi:sugar ABC transporter permease [Conexibacter woesei]|uniref:Xylose transport system permease protein XylH n=1 Tax=Conexibacter woesei (strain DSM 14684 / CCUG 47730 / CIP 108061 / JCM 11494 / NBRC 100937 / ID131577) TaxID=469383 RepID=D3FFF1_CONWI|nr:ABC transporter permease [Conexibacter woesei]ADB53744.1 inner-membrane translocator [Conexibacter woesei DSM 14684]